MITDEFIQKVGPEILSHTDEVTPGETPLDTFLAINDRLRKINHQTIDQVTSQSAERLLWNQPFLQLSNSQVESAFADFRSYYYNGEKVDEQTHLGFDLASLAQSPVECSNDGIVAFADYLGIYGNCVLVDHGLGLYSLYGHLSSLEVKTGDQVSRGQMLGRTGETGLAGGDHLHFSMILQGVPVTPLEWWDEKWVNEHLLSKLEAPRGEGTD